MASRINPRGQSFYKAVYRLAARPYALSATLTTNTRTQFATIHHLAASLKRVKLRHVWVALESVSVGTIIVADLVRITAAPVTGNPAITPTPANIGDAAADSVCLALPTTPATEGVIHTFTEFNQGITGAAPTVNPPAALTWYDLLLPSYGVLSVPFDDALLPEIRPGVLEGYAVSFDNSGVSPVTKAFVIIEFSEEQ